MTFEEQVLFGALLHDIGKVLQRSNRDRQEHSAAGYEYLKNISPIRTVWTAFAAIMQKP